MVSSEGPLTHPYWMPATSAGMTTNLDNFRVRYLAGAVARAGSTPT